MKEIKYRQKYVRQLAEGVTMFAIGKVTTER